ncbi:MAG: hypothetical protein HUU45_10910, partial [Leptospiraceae bacterium]|nr:hypothetical protein [Leptospiraceae bacterium]
MKIAVVLFFFFIIEIFASEIAFLPVILRKDFSENNRIHNISEISLAELSGFYAEENFLIDVSKIKNYSNLLPKTFSKQFLSNKCTELEADYLFLSEVEITDSTSISSRVYNCRGRFVSQNDTVIRADFFNSFEKHIRKTLNFLPEKKKSEPIHGLEKEEIFFLIDPSPGFMEERQNLESLIREIKDISNVSIGLIFPSRKKPKFISPSIGNSEVLNNLANFHKEKIFLEDVRDSIFYSFRNLQESKTKNKKFIIATGSKPKSDPFDFSEVVSSLTRLDYEVYIITGSYFDSTIMEIYKKAGRKNKNGLQYITHYQKLGSSDGLKTIFINDGKV